MLCASHRSFDLFDQTGKDVLGNAKFVWVVDPHLRKAVLEVVVPAKKRFRAESETRSLFMASIKLVLM